MVSWVIEVVPLELTFISFNRGFSGIRTRISLICTLFGRYHPDSRRPKARAFYQLNYEPKLIRWIPWRGSTIAISPASLFEGTSDTPLIGWRSSRTVDRFESGRDSRNANRIHTRRRQQRSWRVQVVVALKMHQAQSFSKKFSFWHALFQLW